MAGGRPSKLTDEAREKARAYVFGGWKDAGDAFPMAAGLALDVGVNKDTLYEWAKHDDEIASIMKALNMTQERVVLTGGAKGDITNVIAKLVLANHNYGEKAQLEHTGAAGGPLVIKWGSSEE